MSKFVSLKEATEILNAQGVVAIPTETVYGLAARIDQPEALRLVFSTKQRPLFDPLIIHVQDAAQAQTLVADWPRAAAVLAEIFWPGPLTLILPKRKEVNELITAGLDSVAVRSPRHPLAQDLLKMVGTALAAPSANRFGKTSPSSAQHVVEEFGGQVPVLDGGPCEVGVESTVLSCLNPIRLEILRPGLITAEEISEALSSKGVKAEVVRAQSVASPGHLEHHYQPEVPLILLSPQSRWSQERHEQILDLLKLKDSRMPVSLNLSSDPVLAARELYREMRQLSRSGAPYIYFEQPSFTNARWEAILDRLSRASSGKL